MEHLRVYKSPYTKQRIGRNNDGGYIICNIDDNYDIFLSGGISGDISFEVDLLKKYPNLKCVAHDGTIKALPNNNNKSISDRITFIKKNLGKDNNKKTKNFNDYFKYYNNIFMKLDIEGGEYPLFESISDQDLKKIKQLVIEFHNPQQIIIPARIAKTHWLVHFHGNNNVKTAIVNGITVPTVFECTYIRKENIDQQLELNTDNIPNNLLDMPNIRNKPDIFIDYEPFVSKMN